MKRTINLRTGGIAIILCLSFCSLTGTSAIAQGKPLYKKGKDSTIEERLVALALQGPSITKGDHQTKINDAQVRKAKNSYFNLLTISTIYSFRSTTSAQGQYTVPPGLNLGITIPLGIIFTKGSDVKIAKETRLLSIASQEQAIREMKADVLSKYKEYLTSNQMVVIQSRIIDDEQAAAAQIEKQFREGKTSIEEYNAVSKNLNNELANRLKLLLQVEQQKLQIEVLIGVPLETVLRNQPAHAQP